MYYNTVNVCYIVINGCLENVELASSILCLYTFVTLRTYDGRTQVWTRLRISSCLKIKVKVIFRKLHNLQISTKSPRTSLPIFLLFFLDEHSSLINITFNLFNHQSIVVYHLTISNFIQPNVRIISSLVPVLYYLLCVSVFAQYP